MTLPKPGETYERDGRKRRVTEVDEIYVQYARKGLLYWCSHEAWKRWAKGAVKV